MRRRDKPGGKAVKTRRPKTLKRRYVPKAERRRNSLAAGKETNVEQLTRELAGAIQAYQAALVPLAKALRACPVR